MCYLSAGYPAHVSSSSHSSTPPSAAAWEVPWDGSTQVTLIFFKFTTYKRISPWACESIKIFQLILEPRTRVAVVWHLCTWIVILMSLACSLNFSKDQSHGWHRKNLFSVHLEFFAELLVKYSSSFLLKTIVTTLRVTGGGVIWRSPRLPRQSFYLCCCIFEQLGL